MLNAAMRLSAPFCRRCWPPLLALAVWALLTWPLPLRMGAAMPYSAHHPHGTQVTHSLVPGDHIQLLYHFWLTRDMLAGGTPWMCNLYEFNDGDDEARRRFDPGYVPFSLVYAAISPRFGHAFGWNMAQLAALLAAFYFLWRLALRYVGTTPEGRPATPALAAAFAAFCAPYQWTNLGAGSPTGFGMAWIPALALGLDIAVRDGRRRGGVLAAVAILFAYASDLHCFFFGALLAPAWCLVAWTARPASFLPTRRDLRTLFLALWPTLLAGVAAVLLVRHLQSGYAATDVAHGRSIAEVLANSPSRRSLFGWILRGPDLHFQLGIPLLALLGVSTVAAFAGGVSDVRRGVNGRRLAAALLLAAGIAGVLVLALGLRGPFEGLPIRAVRKLLPAYRMIRQPVKILALLPTLLAALSGLGLGVLWQGVDPAAPGRRKLGRAAVFVLCALCLFQTDRILRYGLCRLPPPSDAYAAVARDAAARSLKPHILALPLWPGDSAWSSIYEYHSMHDRVRMLNGYAPVRTSNYTERVFHRFESVTQGRLTDDQVADLRSMGVTAVVLHEEFPDMVSPFPVGATLRRLRASPWLDELAYGGSAWAFALRETPRESVPPAEADAVFAPARWWRQEAAATTTTNGLFAAQAVLRSPVAAWPALRWLVRTEGDGTLRAKRGFRELRDGDGPVSILDEVSLESGLFFAKHTAGPAAPTPTLLKRAGPADKPVRWLTVPIGALPGDWATPGLKLTTTTGTVRVTDILLAAGPSSLDQAALRLPAAYLFRGGQTTMRDGEPHGVRFRPTHDGPGDVLYGPNLPLAPGRWRVRVEGEFAAPVVGILKVILGIQEAVRGPVGSGAPPLEFATDAMQPVVLRVAYAGRAEARFDALALERIEGPVNTPQEAP